MEDERRRRFILLGLSEEDDSVELKTSVAAVLEEIGHKPVISGVRRLGQPGSKPRPVKVVCESADTVHSILKASPKLKSSLLFSRVYIVPDRTPEQRLARKSLVEELKEKIETGPIGIRYYIKNGKVNDYEEPRNLPVWGQCQHVTVAYVDENGNKIEDL